MPRALLESLPELQHAFRSAIYAEGGDTASGLLRHVIVEAGLAANVRLGIYRNNMVSNLCNALMADFPVVARLVGEDFFRQAARAYIAATPSTSGDINDYGEAFPAFLAELPTLAGLPYVGDVACLEQAWKEVFHAPAAETIDLASLVALAPESLGDLRFQMHPALRLLSSDYPVMQIWQANQPNALGSEVIDLRQGGDCLLLQRINGDVGMERLLPAEHAWLVALSSGCRLADAVEAAFARDEAFELAPCLQHHVARDVFSEFVFGEKE